jgi:hypothetical protein
MEEQTINNKIIDNVNSYLNNKTFQKIMDITRILLLIVAIIIVFILITNIEQVKLLNNDVCAICMNKTGATCIAKSILT